MEVTTRRGTLAGLARGLGRHPRIWAFGLVALLFVAPWAWWSTQLWGLPDVGDPFDVDAFEAERDVPDDRNAFLVYRDAVSYHDKAWKGFRTRHPDSARQMVVEWSKADPPWRDFLAEDRQALDLFRVGSERPDARHLYVEGLTFHTILDVNQNLRRLAQMAILEASRLESEGDMAGAWGWYRAAFRSSRHTGQHGFLLERVIGAAMHKEASGPLTRWASDPRVDAPLLRRALDEFLSIDTMTAPHSAPLKMEYLVFRNSLADPQLIDDLLLQREEPTDWCDDLPVSAATKKPIQAVRLALADDRERSLRVVRLMLANWLAQVDKPPSLRSKLASKAPPIYEADPNAPPASRALAPEALARWLDSTLLARRIYTFQAKYSPPIDLERARQARLVVHLADQLYRREHGGPPPSPQALVGPYLKALPEGFDSPGEPEKARP